MFLVFCFFCYRHSYCDCYQYIASMAVYGLAWALAWAIRYNSSLSAIIPARLTRDSGVKRGRFCDISRDTSEIVDHVRGFYREKHTRLVIKNGILSSKTMKISILKRASLCDTSEVSHALCEIRHDIASFYEREPV